MVDLKKLVTFISRVVNATVEVKSKTERIQIIIKAAAHHLDCSGMTWEEVISVLKQARSNHGLDSTNNGPSASLEC